MFLLYLALSISLALTSTVNGSSETHRSGATAANDVFLSSFQNSLHQACKRHGLSESDTLIVSAPLLQEFKPRSLGCFKRALSTSTVNRERSAKALQKDLLAAWKASTVVNDHALSLKKRTPGQGIEALANAAEKIVFTASKVTAEEAAIAAARNAAKKEAFLARKAAERKAAELKNPMVPVVMVLGASGEAHVVTPPGVDSPIVLQEQDPIVNSEVPVEEKTPGAAKASDADVASGSNTKDMPVNQEPPVKDSPEIKKPKYDEDGYEIIPPPEPKLFAPIYIKEDPVEGSDMPEPKFDHERIPLKGRVGMTEERWSPQEITKMGGNVKATEAVPVASGTGKVEATGAEPVASSVKIAEEVATSIQVAEKPPSWFREKVNSVKNMKSTHPRIYKGVIIGAAVLISGSILALLVTLLYNFG